MIISIREKISVKIKNQKVDRIRIFKFQDKNLINLLKFIKLLINKRLKNDQLKIFYCK